MPGIKPSTTSKQSYRLVSQWRSELEDHVQSLIWSPDGKWLAAAAVSGPVYLFDSNSGALRHTLAGHSFGTTVLDWNPAGTCLASAGQDGKIRGWNPETGQTQLELEGGAAWVEQLAWSPDGAYLASGAGRKLRLWNKKGELVREYAGHASTISAVAWEPGTPVLASAAYGGITFWSPDQAEPLSRFQWKGSVLAMAWSPDRKYLATGDQDSTVHFWIVKNGQDFQMYGYPTKVRELAWDQGSRYLATGGSASVTVWDCSGKGPENTTPGELKGHEDLISTLSYQHHGQLLASGGLDGKVLLWQPEKQHKALAKLIVGAGISQLTWHQDDRRLAAGTENGEVLVLEVEK